MPSPTRLMTMTINSILDTNTSHPGFVWGLADTDFLQTFSYPWKRPDKSHTYMHVLACMYVWHTHSLKEDHWWQLLTLESPARFSYGRQHHKSRSGFSYYVAYIFVEAGETLFLLWSSPLLLSSPAEFPWTNSWRETGPNILAQTIINFKYKMKLQVTDYYIILFKLFIYKYYSTFYPKVPKCHLHILFLKPECKKLAAINIYITCHFILGHRSYFWHKRQFSNDILLQSLISLIYILSSDVFSTPWLQSCGC